MAQNNQHPHTNIAWHARSPDEVLQELEAQKAGLSAEEAAKRLEKYGPNSLARGKKESALSRFLRQFKNILIYILVAAAVISGLLGEFLDMWVIFAVVLIIGVIGFIQEGKAAQALESIRDMLSLDARVRRGGKVEVIPAEEVVPGDIVLLKGGDKVPADLRLILVKDAQIQEAALTGESEPVMKSTNAVAEDSPTGDRECMAYSSTLVSSGSLEGVVVATGQQSEIGRIGQLVSEVEELTTPLMRKVEKFGRWLSVAILGLSASVFAFGLVFRDYQVGELLMIAVSIAVAAIPEGLPAVMTITLALGVQSMARRHAIIRRLPAVETLGSVTVICSDKTGTLTRNEMTVKRILMVQKAYAVEGTGYTPEGKILHDDQAVDLSQAPDLKELVRAGFLCNDAKLKKNKDDGQWRVQGEPTDGGVYVLGRKTGLEHDAAEKEFPRVDEIPFRSENRYMATLHHTPEESSVIYLKGAPEKVLELCDKQRSEEKDDSLDQGLWEKKMDEIASEGHRVLAIAVKNIDGKKAALDPKDTESGFTLLGLLGLIDPPRDEAIRAIDKCREAGIRVKMITGDHVLTARSIGAQMGIGDGEHSISGREIEKMSDAELHDLVGKTDIFARSSPEHKIRLVKALQSLKEIVAMTGDGVNDAPALKRADIGIAMGIKGSEAAKDASEMVLTDDNFASIEKAVEEGRAVYDNLQKTILFILPASGAQSFAVLAAVLFAFALMPVTPLQILWVNMVVAVTLGMSLAFEPAEADIMQRPPRRHDEPILSRHLLWRIFFVSLLIAGLTLWAFLGALDNGMSPERSRTLAVNVLMAGQFFYLFNSRFFFDSSFNVKGFIGNAYALIAAGALIVLQLALTYAPPLQVWFGTEDIGLGEWGLVIASGIVVFVLVEVEKAVIRYIDAKKLASQSDRG
ncbi:potassium and/or sodium efflux P-type ATPase [Geoalkalibacter ferrihydriticus]|uniref:Potassium and/or sodium efflux P-type ATPase n=1 Tax=Geoalkalibacter ferrihydriticus TaxID=392333 RepID=A0A1G9N0P7_9BACT|nr:cation-transporting P-type ATPase [Geoalkalibacter ferrihydriticus]SDL80112.1 potassium and/or sodium efflux P-type ATPase [Geoalkalibacter ferrihydriticus]